MANYKHTRTIQDSIRIRGTVTDDGTGIIYFANDDEYKVDVSDIMKRFAGMDISFSIGTKDEQDIEDQ